MLALDAALFALVDISGKHVPHGTIQNDIHTFLESITFCLLSRAHFLVDSIDPLPNKHDFYEKLSVFISVKPQSNIFALWLFWL